MQTDIKHKKISIAEICENVSELLISKYNFKTIAGNKEDEIWIYDNGCYRPEGKALIKSQVEKKLGVLCKTHIVNEIINKIGRKTYILRENFDCKDLDLICVKNGVYSLKTGKLMPHSPDYNFKSAISINYNKTKVCWKIQEFLHGVLYEEDVPVMQEWLGFCLYRNYFLKKGMILVGVGDTGKTTALNLIIKFIGSKNMSGISLQDISGDKFSTVSLYGKHINVYDDLSSTDLQEVGTFKMVTGNGWISGEQKFCDKFSFRNFAKLMFATNKIPKIKNNDDDTAYYKRWIVLRFDNVFDKTNKKTNKNLINEIVTEDEMSGLFNWAVEGLRRILKNQDFSLNSDLKDIKYLMERNSSDIAKFVHDCCEKGNSDDWISKDDMWLHYKEYCELNDLTINPKESLGKCLPSYCNYILDSRQGQKTGWRHITVKKIKPIYDF